MNKLPLNFIDLYRHSKPGYGMYKTIDIDNWKRKETFRYFGGFDYPFFNVCLNQDISVLHSHCKEHRLSLNHALHFCSILSANEIEEFRIRYKDGGLVIFDKIDGGATILLEDHSIRFCLYEFSRSYTKFAEAALQSEEMVRKTGHTDARTANLDVVHYSVLPWMSFTSISHPRNNPSKDSIPKITFGRYFKSEQKTLIPISVEVNHALMDGYQVSAFLNSFHEKMNLFVGGEYM